MLKLTFNFQVRLEFEKKIICHVAYRGDDNGISKYFGIIFGTLIIFLVNSSSIKKIFFYQFCFFPFETELLCLKLHFQCVASVSSEDEEDVLQSGKSVDGTSVPFVASSSVDPGNGMFMNPCILFRSISFINAKRSLKTA